MKRIAIFASGSGSNAENIVDFFATNEMINIALIVSSNANAMVLQRASRLDIPSLTLTKSMFKESQDLIAILQALDIDLIVLAGFLWLIPPSLVEAFPNKIINIHPALLPKYGGKGMYGSHIHQAVKEQGDTETGITVHFVNEKYDEGQIIKQVSCQLLSTDTVEDIATKIHELEFVHFPKVIEDLLR